MGLDCRKCNTDLKLERGCEKESTIPEAWNINGLKLNRCPLKIVKAQSFEYIKFYNFYKDGHLPNKGAILEQPAKFLDAIRIIEKALSERLEEYGKRKNA